MPEPALEVALAAAVLSVAVAVEESVAAALELSVAVAEEDLVAFAEAELLSVAVAVLFDAALPLEALLPAPVLLLLVARARSFVKSGVPRPVTCASSSATHQTTTPWMVATYRVPASDSREALRATAGVAALGDVVERSRTLRVQERVEEAE